MKTNPLLALGRHNLGGPFFQRVAKGWLAHAGKRGGGGGGPSSPPIWSWLASSLSLAGHGFTRASTASVTDNLGQIWQAAAGWPRFQGARIADPLANGQLVYYSTDAGGAPIDPATINLLMEPAATNYALNSATPATHTTGSLPIGTYVCWISGAGSVAVTPGTATLTGNGTATAATPDVFNVTAAGTITLTVTGTVSFLQVEPGSIPTSRILTTAAAATRAVDALAFSGVPLDNETRMVVDGADVDITDWNGVYPTPVDPDLVNSIKVYDPAGGPQTGCFWTWPTIPSWDCFKSQLLTELKSSSGIATRSAMGANLAGTNKWLGGVLGPDGKIYGIPLNATDILIIDTIAGTATRSAMGATLADASKWYGGVLGPDGKIYGIPRDATSILIVDGTPVSLRLALDPRLNKF